MTSPRLFKALESRKKPQAAEFLYNALPTKLHTYCLLILLGSDASVIHSQAQLHLIYTTAFDRGISPMWHPKSRKS